MYGASMSYDTKKAAFMAIVTLFILVFVQAASLYGIYIKELTVGEYLSVWTPLLTLAVGYWFGKS